MTMLNPNESSFPRDESARLLRESGAPLDMPLGWQAVQPARSPFERLSEDVIFMIVSLLDPKTARHFALTCRRHAAVVWSAGWTTVAQIEAIGAPRWGVNASSARALEGLLHRSQPAWRHVRPGLRKIKLPTFPLYTGGLYPLTCRLLLQLDVPLPNDCDEFFISTRYRIRRNYHVRGTPACPILRGLLDTMEVLVNDERICRRTSLPYLLAQLGGLGYTERVFALLEHGKPGKDYEQQGSHVNNNDNNQLGYRKIPDFYAFGMCVLSAIKYNHEDLALALVRSPYATAPKLDAMLDTDRAHMRYFDDNFYTDTLSIVFQCPHLTAEETATLWHSAIKGASREQFPRALALALSFDALDPQLLGDLLDDVYELTLLHCEENPSKFCFYFTEESTAQCIQLLLSDPRMPNSKHDMVLNNLCSSMDEINRFENLWFPVFTTAMDLGRTSVHARQSLLEQLCAPSHVDDDFRRLCRFNPDYISPFIRRLFDNLGDSVHITSEIRRIVDEETLPTVDVIRECIAKLSP